MWKYLKSAGSLRLDVMIAFILLWNTGFLVAIYAGGGQLDALLSSSGQMLAGFTCFAAAVFALAIAGLDPVRKRLVAPARAHDFTPEEFYFIAFVTAGLGASLVFTSPAPPAAS